ncbi:MULTISPECIES: LCP family protein [Mammaliicoccus]|uniref:LCP family protein n=1 Tax=Mammaliicoccus TaxID=2803850 RepID=UPI000CD20FAF|nr:LCP family protein [Mammaliicoccus lentus]HBV02791.1 LytR family transcriptional regulator [Staphylococcus sp.]POA04116.1 LytR family transcriptional regulator [Mammaliicoccus lentus]WHI55132.1 LCP family protein [Mammaliicoccus lentus]WHI57654.1 LCP family protein [Mammaliicoccus lentus]WHI65503.1 LCP family protein [Mammaliicoccus lentus]
MANQYERSAKKPKSAAFKIVTTIIIVLLIAFLIIIGYFVYKFFALGNTIHNPLDRDKSELRKNAVDTNGDPISIALFGIDSDSTRSAEGGGERSDSIVLLSINPDKKKTVMVSIPRDTRAEIVGNDSVEKINHAYAYGGPKMAINSVEKLMNVPVDHYATINMDGVKDLVDYAGGVNVTSNATFTVKGKSYVKGQKYKLNGEEALAFIRSRKEEGAGGDFGRQERQQLVIQALANELVSVGSLPKINQIFDTLGDNVKTDMKIGQLNDLRSKYNDALDNVDRNQLEGQDSILDDGLYYFVPSDASKRDIVDSYRENLGLE